MLSGVSSAAKALGHYLDQPAVIGKIYNRALYAGLGAGSLALLARDLKQAPSPEARQRIAIRDGLVLGATVLGTAFAAKKLMPHMAEAVQIGKEALLTLKDRYTPELMALLEKSVKTFGEMRQILGTVSKPDLATLFPVEHRSVFSREALKKIGKILAVGGASVLSGMAGGYAANHLNNEPEGTNLNMLKEGVFQFTANIFMCTLGAVAGMGLADSRTVEKVLSPLGILGKIGGRFLLVAGGLMAGLSFGGALANKISQRLTPATRESMLTTASTTAESSVAEQFGGNPIIGQRHSNERKIEIWDAILHADDIPTALYFAGVEIFKPFIPLFFAFSGYRAGIGYRNGEPSNTQRKAPRFSTALSTFSAPVRFAKNPVFRYLHEHQTQQERLAQVG